jgi:hypothetical protein
MTCFHVDVDALKAHAAAVSAIGADVTQAAAAESAGMGQADFGILIGVTLGIPAEAFGMTFQQSTQTLAEALVASGTQLAADATNYAQAEDDSCTVISATDEPS